jgi:hypothetical protein
MAFANPLVISVNSVNKTLIKINQDNYGSEYYLRESTGEYRAKIRHSRESAIVGSGQVHRSNFDLTYTIFSTTPGVPDNVRQVYLVLRNGVADDATLVGYIGAALSALLVQARYEDLVAWAN